MDTAQRFVDSGLETIAAYTKWIEDVKSNLKKNKTGCLLSKGETTDKHIRSLVAKEIIQQFDQLAQVIKSSNLEQSTFGDNTRRRIPGTNWGDH